MSPATPADPLGERIHAYIRQTSAGWGWAGQGPDPFDSLASELVRAQAARPGAYGRWLASRGFAPDGAAAWQQVPPVPTDAFKAVELSAVPPEEAAAVFMTSGTTLGQRGRHIVKDLRYYREAMVEPFVRHLLPERRRLPWLRFTPPWPEDASSSLGFMVEGLLETWAGQGSAHYQREGALDFDGAWADLRAAEAGGPVLLLGTAFAWVHLLDHAPGARVRLPPGSRLMETGGFKGRSREVPRHELRAQLVERLGLSPAHLVGEYGMTELSSQLYEAALADTATGQAAGPGYHAPPWVRVRLLDPATLTALPPGEVGVVAIFDLANVDTVASIVTADLGRLLPGGGLELLGRAAGATLRGCSLQVEELVGAGGQR